MTFARQSAGQEQAAATHRLGWHYPKFRSEEYAAASFVSLIALSFELRSSRIPNGSWNGGILVDDALRDSLRARSPQGRRWAARVSDVVWMATQWYPFADAVIVPLGFDDANDEVAVQMLLLGWQAESFAFLLTRGFHRTVGRQRPLAKACAADGCAEEGDANNASFLSGHTSMAFAGAGLACAHHQALPLYGGDWDSAACAIALASASTAGILRVVADKHWASDVVAGGLMGFAIGYGMPMLLHYSLENDIPTGQIGRRAVLVPDVRPGSYGISMVGML